jgi:hypothetical protein
MTKEKCERCPKDATHTITIVANKDDIVICGISLCLEHALRLGYESFEGEGEEK